MSGKILERELDTNFVEPWGGWGASGEEGVCNSGTTTVINTAK